MEANDQRNNCGERRDYDRVSHSNNRILSVLKSCWFNYTNVQYRTCKAWSKAVVIFALSGSLICNANPAIRKSQLFKKKENVAAALKLGTKRDFWESYTTFFKFANNLSFEKRSSQGSQRRCRLCLPNARKLPLTPPHHLLFLAKFPRSFSLLFLVE